MFRLEIATNMSDNLVIDYAEQVNLPTFKQFLAEKKNSLASDYFIFEAHA